MKNIFSSILLIIISLSCYATKKECKTILLVSGWQDVNIGDIAHTPGLIHVLNTYLPDANIIVWKKSPSETVDELLHKHFPNVKIIKGKVNENGDPDNKEVYEALEKADRSEEHTSELQSR